MIRKYNYEKYSAQGFGSLPTIIDILYIFVSSYSYSCPLTNTNIIIEDYKIKL